MTNDENIKNARCTIQIFTTKHILFQTKIIYLFLDDIILKPCIQEYSSLKNLLSESTLGHFNSLRDC